jgi:phage shock protein PspC (stress-responsive transcriptional regulator)
MNIKQTLNSLHRSRKDQMLGGVCAGFGEVTDTPAWLWRAGFLFVAFWLGSGLLLYVILWITMPYGEDTRPR